MKKNEFLKIFKCLLILIFVVTLAIIGYLSIKERMVVDRIAAQFQITPSWEKIQEHLYYEEFIQGLSRDEVHKILDKVGKWEIEWFEDPNKDIGNWDIETNQYVFNEIIHFSESETIKLRNLGFWSFSYDKNDNLVEQHRLESGG